MSKALVIIPRISEKTFRLAQKRTYVFTVPTQTNKNQIAAAVSAQYDVTVDSVNVAIQKGKNKRSMAKGGRASYKGTRTDSKRAYVTLAEGQSIKLFDEEEQK